MYNINMSSTSYFLKHFLTTALAIFIGYLFVSKYIEPTIFYENCLTDTNNCSVTEMYRYNNTFIAHEQISDLWFWYNGKNLYIYGQAAGTCTDPNYEVVNVCSLSIQNSTIQFNFLPNECVTKIDQILSDYKKQFNVQQEIFYTRKSQNVENIFSIVQQLYDNNIFKIF
jgi:hypothetical protein